MQHIAEHRFVVYAANNEQWMTDYANTMNGEKVKNKTKGESMSIMFNHGAHHVDYNEFELKRVKNRQFSQIHLDTEVQNDCN